MEKNSISNYGTFLHFLKLSQTWFNKTNEVAAMCHRIPERYEIKRRSFNHTVGKTIRAVRIPNRCVESSWKPDKSIDVPGNSRVRLSPSKVINSTQAVCTCGIIVSFTQGYYI